MKTSDMFFRSLISLFFAFFLVSCSKEQSKNSPDSLDKITEKKILRVGTDFVGTPFAYYQDGKEVGFEVELIQELGKELGVEIQWVNIPFSVSNFIQAFDEDRVDVGIESISLTSERREKFLFSQPYFFSGQSVVVRQTENVPDQFNLSLLKDKKVGVQKGTTGEIFAKNNTSALVVLFDSSEQLLEALINGEVDAVISDILNTQTTSWPMWKKIKVILKNLTHEEYCVVAKNNQPKMMQQINDILQKFKDDPIDGVYARLYRKWFF